MSYTPKYTSEADVESLLQVTIDTNTKPTTAQTLDWIEQIEKGLDFKLFGVYATGIHPTGMMCDVLPISSMPSGTINWFEYITTYGYAPTSGVIVIPPLLPLLNITQVYRNTQASNEAPYWELLTEGPCAGSSFMPLKKVGKQAREYIWGLFFYDNLPIDGIRKVEIVGNYGYDIENKILKEYATLLVADKVLFAKIRTSDPGGLTMFTGGGLTRHVQVEWGELRRAMNERKKEMEALYLPTPRLRMAMI